MVRPLMSLYIFLLSQTFVVLVGSILLMDASICKIIQQMNLCYNSISQGAVRNRNRRCHSATDSALHVMACY